MRFIKLLPTILKNLSFMVWEYKPTRLALIILIIGGIAFSGYRYYKNSTDPNNPNISLANAAKIGEVMTHKLMVEIDGKNCPPEKSAGCYERGDIIAIHPSDRDFSDGEKESFLILKMDLTDKQAEILMHPEDKISRPKDIPVGSDAKIIPPTKEVIKLRRYSVDLKKIGIGDDVTAGRVVDAIYKWDILKEK